MFDFSFNKLHLLWRHSNISLYEQGKIEHRQKDMSFKRYTYLCITKVSKIIRWSYSGIEVQCPKTSESLCKYLVLNMKLIKPWRDLCNMKLFPLAILHRAIYSVCTVKIPVCLPLSKSVSKWRPEYKLLSLS